MQYFINILKSIGKHPLTHDKKLKTTLDFLKWEFFSRITGYRIVFPFVNDSTLIVKNGMDGATGNVIFGLMEYNDMSFVLHFLKENDLFVDVGANVGVYTILASKIGRANSIAVEPIPTTYQYLLENLRINEIGDFVETYNAGLGAEASNLYFTSSLDVDNRVIMESEDVRYDKISVPVLRLDSIVSSNIPSLIKIDVEGYESKVLEGGEQTLKNKDLKAIIIELNGSGKKFGFDDDEIHNSLLAYAFKPYSYEPNKRELLELSTYGKYNTIYIRDLEYVTRRIKSANPFKINKYSLSI